MAQTPEEVRAKRREHYQRTREKQREKARAYYKDHAEERREYDRRRYDEKLEKSREWRRRHYQKNKVEKLAYAREYAKSESGRTVIRARLERPEVRERERKNQRRWMLMNYYGLTLERYDEMVVRQDGRCAICLQPETGVDKRTGKPWPLAVDHDHATGDVRGLLCRRCNQVIGRMEDNVQLVQAALSYLVLPPALVVGA